MATFTPRVRRNRSLHNGYTVIGRPETVGERLRRLRQAKGWTLRDLAQRADTNTTTISEAENDKHDIWSGTLARLANALGVCMTELWTGEPCGGAP